MLNPDFSTGKKTVSNATLFAEGCSTESGGLRAPPRSTVRCPDVSARSIHQLFRGTAEEYSQDFLLHLAGMV